MDQPTASVLLAIVSTVGGIVSIVWGGKSARHARRARADRIWVEQSMRPPAPGVVVIRDAPISDPPPTPRDRGVRS